MRELILFFLLFGFSANPANLHGVILDPAGHPVVKAAVDVSRMSGGQTAWFGTTNAAGQFTTSLADGEYRLHISANGFE